MNRRAFFTAMAGAPFAAFSATHAKTIDPAKGGYVKLDISGCVGECGPELIISRVQAQRLVAEATRKTAEIINRAQGHRAF